MADPTHKALWQHTHTTHKALWQHIHTSHTQGILWQHTHTPLVQRDKWPNCPATKTQFPAGQISRELKLREAGVPGMGITARVPHQVTSNCEWVFLMNEWDHWAVWPTLKQSIASGVLNIHRKGLNQRKLTWNTGPLLPGKLPFHPSHPFPNSPLTLLRAPRRCPTHPAHFLFIHSLIQQTLTGTYCVSASVPGPGKTGRPDPACLPALLGTGRQPFPCSSHPRQAPCQASSSENYGFSISSSWRSPRAGAVAQKIFLFTCIIGFFFKAAAALPSKKPVA